MGNRVSKRNTLTWRETVTVLSLTLLFINFQNCAKASFSSSAASGNVGAAGDPVICNPLGGGGTGSPQQGLVGKLLYVPIDKQDPQNLKTFDNVLNLSVTSNVTIYTSQMNVPTRNWTEGFSTAPGSSLNDDQGNKLLEYFMLRMQSVIKLSASDAPGYYQFATISDDGAIMYTTVNGVDNLLAGFRGTIHSTRSDCGSVATYLDSNTSLPFNLDYFQGPRDYIAMVLMWRKVDDPSNLNQMGCNVTNDDSKDFYAPGNTYASMAAQGWQVVPASNFWLPESTAPNPCGP